MAVVLVVVLIAMVVMVGDTPVDGSHRALDLWVVVFLAAAAGLVFWSRRAPAFAAFSLLGLSVVWYGVGYTSRLIDVPTLVAFYQLGRTGDRRRQVAVAAVTVGTLVFAAFGNEEQVRVSLTGVGLTVAAILSGELMRGRQLLLDQHTERTARAERERDIEAERRVAEERLRIARDVHDVLAHTVSLMTVQAGVASDAMARDPAAAARALETIRTAGKQAMGEIRSTVSVLRGTGPALTAPAPGLDALPELVETTRSRGLTVDLTMDVGDASVDALVGLTAYRVVQESLTNVGRHAHASRVQVEVGLQDDTLVLAVTDDGITAWRAPDPSAGYGLRGMRERVDALGGTVAFGPTGDGGWCVRATLPLSDER
jgi:signal transduction histidine kinase